MDRFLYPVSNRTEKSVSGLARCPVSGWIFDRLYGIWSDFWLDLRFPSVDPVTGLSGQKDTYSMAGYLFNWIYGPSLVLGVFKEIYSRLSIYDPRRYKHLFVCKITFITFPLVWRKKIFFFKHDIDSHVVLSGFPCND